MGRYKLGPQGAYFDANDEGPNQASQQQIDALQPPGPMAPSGELPGKFPGAPPRDTMAPRMPRAIPGGGDFPKFPFPGQGGPVFGKQPPPFGGVPPGQMPTKPVPTGGVWSSDPGMTPRDPGGITFHPPGPFQFEQQGAPVPSRPPLGFDLEPDAWGGGTTRRVGDLDPRVQPEARGQLLNLLRGGR